MINPPTLTQISIVFALVGVLYGLIKHRANPHGRDLEGILQKLLAASSVPTGILLLACGFNTSLLDYVTDVGLYVTAAGVALLYVAVKEILK